MIELRGIERDFTVGDEVVHALRHVNLTLIAGDYVSVMGPSGSGKSTLLNVLGLLDRPSAGRYQLDGKETTGLTEERRAVLRREHIGFVFQAFHLVPRLSAADNIGLPLVLAGRSPTRRAARVAEVLAALDLEHRADHRPDQLSGGQRQRVAIGRAIVMQPRLLLADEPTGNLDRHAGDDVVALLERLNAGGITLIVVTHDPAIGQRARRHVRMVDGVITTDRVADATG
jgi:putative ABC transport system ATP-binding protein